MLDDRFDTLAIDIRPVSDPDIGREGPAVGPGADATAGGRPDLGPATGEQVSVTNAAAWHAAGITGTGVKIGVIDFFDVSRFWNSAEHGPIPVSGVTARCFAFGQNCTAGYFDAVSEIGDDHGVAVVEIIKDMAPGADIYIGTASTLDDYRDLVDWFATQGVTIVSRSLSGGYDGPGDGRSALNDLAAHANAIGITWVNSAGNAGLGRYYRHQVRLIGNRVAFGDAGSTTFLPFLGCAALSGVRWANDWDRAPADRTDYDIYLWDAPSGNPGAGRLVAASTGDQRGGAVPIEFFEQDHCPTSRTRVLYLEVRWVGGDIAGDVLEILDNASGLAEFTQAPYSASNSIADSTLAGVLAVGAIDPPLGGGIAAYSSQGPTNDGRIAPDISATCRAQQHRLPQRVLGHQRVGTRGGGWRSTAQRQPGSPPTRPRSATSPATWWSIAVNPARTTSTAPASSGSPHHPRHRSRRARHGSSRPRRRSACSTPGPRPRSGRPG